MVADIVKSSVELISSYRKWIIANPQLLADIESTVRYLSYFSAGRYNNSIFASELIHSLPNLIVLFNDLLIYSGQYVNIKLPQIKSKIKIWLTILEYTETIFEVSAKKLWGETGKWAVIAFIQIFKTIMRLLLVHSYKERITKNPPIAPLNREKLKKVCEDKEQIKEGFNLKRSGTIVRSVKASGPIQFRSWEPLPPDVNENLNLSNLNVSQTTIILAETLYIIKPLVHLGSMSISGQKHWHPWIISFVMDIASLNLLSNSTKAGLFTQEDKREFFRRKASLLLYLLRSPFYDKYSRAKIYSMLDRISKTVPLARFVAEPLKTYLPHWQDVYFYMWSC